MPVALLQLTATEVEAATVGLAMLQKPKTIPVIAVLVLGRVNAPAALIVVLAVPPMLRPLPESVAVV